MGNCCKELPSEAEKISPDEDTKSNIEPPHALPKQDNSHWASFAAGLGGFVLVFALLAVGVGVYQVYAKAAINPLAYNVARVFALPAAKVNGKYISYVDYADDRRALTLFRNYSTAAGNPNASLTDEQISDQAIYRLATNILTADLAKIKKIDITDADVKSISAQAMQEFQSKEAADVEINKRYGWSFSVFEEKIFRPLALRNKLAEQTANDEERREQVRRQADNILQEIKNGADFAEMARQYGEDDTAAKGGELDWFGKGEMVAPFEDRVLALKKGELSDTLVETSFGYHIVQVTDKKTEETTDANGKKTSSDKIQARQILFRFPAVEQDLTDALKSAKVKLYIKVNNPFLALK